MEHRSLEPVAEIGRAAGFVCAVGGWLSHTAILAREYDVAMIVATAGINGIRDGDRLRLHPDGEVEILDEGRAYRAYDSDALPQAGPA